METAGLHDQIQRLRLLLVAGRIRGFAAGAGTKCSPGVEVDGIADEVHGSVGEDRVDPSRMETTGRDVGGQEGGAAIARPGMIVDAVTSRPDRAPLASGYAVALSGEFPAPP